jgi:hypothetical protein
MRTTASEYKDGTVNELIAILHLSRSADMREWEIFWMKIKTGKRCKYIKY